MNEVEPVDPASAAAQPTAPSLSAQAVWLLVAKTVGFAFAVALPLILVRRLSQTEFGIYKQIFLVVQSATLVLPLGFGMSAFHFLPRERHRQGAVIINIVAFQAIVGIAVSSVLLLAPQLLANVFGTQELTNYAQLTACVVVLWTIGSFLEIAPVALQDVRATAGLIIGSQFSKTVLLMGAAVLGGTVRSLIIAAIVHGVVQIVVMVVYLHRRFPHFWQAFDRGLLRQQAEYALPIGGSNLVLRLQDDVHHAFVSNAFGPAGYAIYSVGVFKLPLIGILRESVGSVVLPRIKELETRNERRKILGLVAAAARKLSLAYLPAYALLMVTGRELMQVLFTNQYVDSWPIFAIAMTSLPLGIIVMDPVTRAHGQRYFFLRLRLAIFGTVVFLLWQFSAALGMLGIIRLVVAAQFAGWAVAVFRMARLLHFRRADFTLFADVARVATSAALAAAVAAVVKVALAGNPAWRILLICAAVFAVVYFAVIVLMGILRGQEIRRLLSELISSVKSRGPRPIDRNGRAGGTAQAPVRSRS